MKRSTWIVSISAALVAAAALAWAFAPRPVEVEVAKATRGHFETTVDEDGKTRLRDRYVVSAPLAGLLTRITLREGDLVHADDIVAKLTPAMSPMLDERTLREQRHRVEAAEANVDLVQARIERARVAVQQAKNEVQRSEQLATQGFVSPTKLETDRLAAVAAQKEMDAALEQRHVAGHEVEQARAALQAVQQPSSAARAFSIRAPVSGRVLRLAQTSETTVALGTPLIELGDIRGLEIVAELLTTDALQAKPGSRVIIDRWGGPGSLEGRVRLVEPGAFTKVSALGVEEQRVRVLIDITTPAERWQQLGDGYRVSVRIVTLSVDNVLRVPVSAVFPLPQREDASGGGMGVFVVQGGRAHIAPVQIGGRNGSEAWIQQGLDAGATVIVYPPSAVKDGVRVKPRAV